MNKTEFDLFTFVAQLKQKKIAFDLCSVRDDAIMVKVAVPGERWEVEFFADGNVEIEVFRSNGEIQNQTLLGELFKRFSD